MLPSFLKVLAIDREFEFEFAAECHFFDVNPSFDQKRGEWLNINDVSWPNDSSTSRIHAPIVMHSWYHLLQVVSRWFVLIITRS